MMKSGVYSTRSRTESCRESKENMTLGPPEKKRKLIQRDDMRQMSALNSNGREALSLLSTKQTVEESVQTVSVNGPEEGEESTMTTSEVEALLNMKMQGKAKHDSKGRMEQMMEYIKKLRACVRQFQQKEAVYILQKEQLMYQMDEHRRQQEANESALKLEKEKFQDEVTVLKQRCISLEGEVVASNAQSKELLMAHDKDLEALQIAEEERTKLSNEIDKLKNEISVLTDQIKSLNDINKRLTEYNTSLQVYNSKLQTDATTATEDNLKTKQEKAAIIETLSSVRGTVAALQTQLDGCKETIVEMSKQKNTLNEELERVRGELQHVIEERDQCFGRIQSLNEENARFKEFTGKSDYELRMLTTKATALEESYMSQAELIKGLRQQLDVANQKLKLADDSLALQKQEGAGYLSKLQDLQARLVEAEHQLREGEVLRRKLHNTIQELKGNIRVFCRVRPILPDDEYGSEIPVVEYPNSMELQGRGVELIQPQQGQKYGFSFDKVFGPEITQEDVFVDISQLVQSALDGYKVCIFAYGQTGSGKTYTMLGQPDVDYHKGIIPRSLEQIFKSSQALRSQGWNFKMQASMLEIYNETIRDLARANSHDAGKQHVVKHDASGNTFVSDLTIVEVTTWEEVSSLLNQAAQSRTVGRTAMNEQSSRSHCVFTLRIAGSNENTEQQVHGVLNLVDLAGSERLSRSGATGERLKETQAINKSLSSLGDVILAIANKEQHVPYRNSKLTYLLQPCLGGDSKTLMFVNISPDPKSFNESLCSLRFAAKVNACEIGVPRRHTSSRMSDTHSRTSNS
ncbi:hypothetical protein SUGI_0805230 [Cryptomeria japonica]|uniref:kinesin-like protein KIN-14C n=1 Tax=Cryptomeria japonica TaxID=3369 RepID=UPI0024149904|nr:kinesin-like protein KIN-14C [Cryptomeria japonica]GLJ39426.1 hypothetical protein SUGI_0805230 [Cryptomeria japonica]